MGIFAKLKQRAVSLGARVAINHHLKRYGHMPELHLNLTDRHVEGQILLKGETAPIQFAADYALGKEGDASMVKLSNIRLSREWMHQMAQDLVAEKPLALPPELAKWVQRLGML